MDKVQQEILSALLAALCEKSLISKEHYGKAKEVVLQTKEYADWFELNGTAVEA